MKVYGFYEYDEIRLFTTREAAERAMEPRYRVYYARLCDPNDDWPGAPGGRLWRASNYKKMGWDAYWEGARKDVDEFEIET